MATRSVPVWEELGRERDVHIVVFSNTSKEITRHHKVVTHFNSEAWSDLIFPLAWHDFSICSRNVDSSSEASPVVEIRDDSSEADVGSNRAVVGALWAWVTIGWPSKGPLCEFICGSKKCEFLFNSEPWLLTLCFWIFENLVSEDSEIGVAWNELLASSVLPSISFGEHQNVVASAERISEVCDRFHDDFRVVGASLVTGRSIIIPLRKIGKGSDLGGESPGLGSESDTATVNPDVLSNDLSALLRTISNLRVLVVELWVVAFHCSVVRCFCLRMI